VHEREAGWHTRSPRCSLDPEIFGSAEAAAAVIRHEIGHCLGFIGHVSNPRSLMHPTSCCPLTITADVRGMMRRLYRLAPGTPVTR
jgi:predicted Zn-dependent protease